MGLTTQLLSIHDRLFKVCQLSGVQNTQSESFISDQQLFQSIMHSQGVIRSLVRFEQEYKKLEQAIQKKEGDIRKHIGIQQQLKLYSESLEQQLDESELARSEFIEKTRKMLSDLKRNNHFLHQQNLQLKQQISVVFEDDKTRKKAYNIDVDLKKHMRTESSKDYIQKTPSRHKFAEPYSYNKKLQLFKTKFDVRQLLTSVQRKKQIQKKIRQLNQKKTIQDYKLDKLHSNSSYHQLYSKNIQPRKEHNKKVQARSSMRKNNASKKSQLNEDDNHYQKIHYKTRSVHKEI